MQFSKVPFACSYLPGKSNVQAIFWTAVLVLLPLSTAFGIWERKLQRQPAQFSALIAASCAVAGSLWLFNRIHGRTVPLDFEDAEPELVVTLGLGPG